MRTQTLQVRRYEAGARDAHNNPVTTYGAPEDWEVWDLAPGAMQEPNQSNRDLSEIAWTVYAPADDAPDYRDRVVVDGDEFSIEGRPADWTRSSLGAGNAGIVVELKRTEG